VRTMFDSVNAAAIPADAKMVAGYVDGRYAWSSADWARFPNAVHVPIAVFPSTNAGVVLDCEAGDATPTQCPGWVRMRRAAGVDPTVYCSYSAWPTVRAAFAAAGEPAPHYWIAGYPDPTDAVGNPVIPAGAVAHQWIDRGPYDESIVADAWPGVDTKEETMNWDDPISPDGMVDANGKQVTDAVKNFIGYSDKFTQDTKAISVANGAKLDAILAQLGAAVTAEQQRDAELLAAMKSVVLASVDPAQIAAALETAGLPQAVVSSLLALLAKASAASATPTTPAAPATV
jgi:hypothetical protein